MIHTCEKTQPPTTAQCEKTDGIACYQVFQLQKAYDLQPLFDKGINGKGETIVVADAFGSPSIAADLKTFDKEEGLPNPPSFKVITPEGKITTTAKNCTATYHPTGPDECSDYYGWADETTLDVEYAHAMAPQANILLVETPVAETEGVTGSRRSSPPRTTSSTTTSADVIAQSFGATENTFPSKQSLLDLRSAFVNAARHGVTVLGVLR